MKPYTAAVALAVSVVAVPAKASLMAINFSALSHAEVDSRIEALIDAARNNGFRLVLANRRAALAAGGNSAFSIRLERGIEYRFAARCDSDCPDVDLVLRDANGRELRANRDTDDVPSFSFVPSHTGTYVVAVEMYRCNASRCQVGAVVMARA